MSMQHPTTALPPGLSVVVPVYNSEGSLEPLVRRLEPILSQLTPRFEVILVNDGSRDGSWRQVEELADGYAFVRGINLMRNYGQHNALLCGIRQACYDTVVTIDDDLQHPPEEIGRLLETLAEGYDVVYGTPQQEQHGFWRDMASQVTKLALQSTMGASIARQVSAFRVFRTSLRRAFESYRSPFVSIDILLTWGTSRFAAVEVRHNPREVGQSNYTFRKLATHALNMMTGFSTIPLQLASILGFGFTLFGIGILVFVLGRYFIQGGSVPGFPFLASVIAIFSGVQLFMLGIIGEYLARMHFRLMDRPSYAIYEVRGENQTGGFRSVRRTTTMELPSIQLSPLDTARFGISTARAVVTTPDSVDESIAFCRENGVTLLIARAMVEALPAAQRLEAHGSQLMDTLIYLSCDLSCDLQNDLPRSPREPSSSLSIRPATAADADAVAAVAAGAFQNYTSHYHADARLDQATCDAVYVSWAERACCDPAVAEVVLVAEWEGQIAGFGVLSRPDPHTGDGRLYAVAPAFHRKGIYRALMVHSQEWFRERGCTHMLYSTQITNIVAQHLCIRLGFTMSHAYYTFHRWFDEHSL